MKSTVIYTRVSTFDQDSGLTSQIEDLNRWAKANQYNVIRTFGEMVSGYDQTKERAQYEEMKNYVIDNNIKHILIWELSRLGRSTSTTLKEIEYFKKNGVNIYFKKENLNTLSDSATDKLLLSMLSSIAEFDRNTIVSQTHRGKVTAALKGKRIGFAIMPYGFAADDKGFIIINEQEATVVRMIYEMYANGKGSGEIAEELNSLHIPTRNSLRGRKRTLKNGKKIEILWRQNTVRKILKSTLYKGERTFKKNIFVEIPSIAIVSNEIWNKVQDNFKSNLGHYTADKKVQYLFKGKIFCGDCELMYKSESRDYKTYVASYYSCSGRKDKGIKCKNGQIRSKFFDEKVYDVLFRHKDLMLKIYKDRAKTFKVEEKQAQIVFYEGLIEKQEKKRRTILGLLKEDEIEKDEFDTDNRKIKSEILKLQASINSIKREIETFSEVDLSGTLTSLLRESNFNIKRDFILKYVDKIKVFKVNQTNIDFTKLTYTEMKSMRTQAFQEPVATDKLTYIEVYAFGDTHPLRIVLSSLTDICYTSDKLTYIMGHLSLK
ncbi:MAG: recombinase family protein [Bacteroidia bacterium]|nr:recombinase family protein [Bacteroidia bacterium]